MTSWRKPPPPKKKHVVIRLWFRDDRGHVSTGNFYWSPSENTFIECSDNPDGIGLYEDDGWVILGWKPPTKRKGRVRR